MKIMVIDDNRELRELLNDALGEMNYEVCLAHDGNHALELLDVFKPQLIMCDIVMPGLEGIELMMRLRESGIPVLAMSGLSRESVISGLLSSLGIMGFLQKPFRIKELQQVVKNVEEHSFRKSANISERL